MSSRYTEAGVDYDTLDAAKRSAISAAASVSSVLALRDTSAVEASRGEPAFAFEVAGRYMATVLECLGTKSTVARQCQEELGINRFDAIGYDTVAAIVNDIICIGALPATVNAYFATGSPDWYRAEGRFDALTTGWARGCSDAGATWGGGESPGLSGIVANSEIDLAGSAVGVIPAGLEPLLGNDLGPGDEIVLINSSGVHANGVSLIRKLASELPDGYATKLESGTTFGEAALRPSEMYVCLVEALLREHVPVTYLSHVTGHGFRKLMRANRDVTYRITSLPEVPEVLDFIGRSLEMSPEESYGTFNMGAGMAIYCKANSGADVVATATSLGFTAVNAGVVEEGPRRVILDSIGVTFGEEDLQLR
jgi:phosphoribosylformylglycinamidine cyclo-ligase